MLNEKKDYITVNNYVFLAAAAGSMLLSYILFGISSLAFGAISVIQTFIIYSAKDKNGDYLYTLVWIINTILACYIGFEFKLSIGFYLFLFIVANYYYLSYNRDPFSDKAIPFVIVFATLGTTLKNIEYQEFTPFLIGAFFSLLAFRIAYKNKLNFEGFKTGLFSRSLYTNRNRNVIISSFVYSIFLFLSLFIPEYLGLNRVYWSSVTFVFLLPPQGKDILKNTIFRFLGATIAALAVVVLVNTGYHSRLLGIIIILIVVFLYPTLNKSSNKLMKTFSMSFLVLLLIEYSLFWNKPNYTIPDARIYETFIGGCIALVANFSLNILNKHKLHI